MTSFFVIASLVQQTNAMAEACCRSLDFLDFFAFLKAAQWHWGKLLGCVWSFVGTLPRVFLEVGQWLDQPAKLKICLMTANVLL